MKESLHLKAVAPACLQFLINQTRLQQLFCLLLLLFRVSGPRVMLQHRNLSQSQEVWNSLELGEAPVIRCVRLLVVPGDEEDLAHIDLQTLTLLARVQLCQSYIGSRRALAQRLLWLAL